MSREIVPTVREQAGSRQWTYRLAVAAAAGALLTSCTSNPDGTPRAPETPAPAAERPSVQPEQPAKAKPSNKPDAKSPCPPVTGTRAASKRTEGGAAQVSNALFIKEADMAGHYDKGGCYDRIVLRYRGDQTPASEWPGIRARYVKPPILLDPSDRPVAVKGRAFLEVSVGASTYGHDGGEGPQRITDGTVRHISEGVLTKNFEDHTTWVFGLDAERRFVLHEVSETQNCPTLCQVIDINVAAK